VNSPINFSDGSTSAVVGVFLLYAIILITQPSRSNRSGFAVIFLKGLLWINHLESSISRLRI
jgi:hypothetical protein